MLYTVSLLKPDIIKETIMEALKFLSNDFSVNLLSQIL